MFPKLNSATKLDANYLQMYALLHNSPSNCTYSHDFLFFVSAHGKERGGGVQRIKPSFVFVPCLI